MMLDAVHADVQALASPERATANAWFFKTGPGQYGEGDVFAGLTLPQMRSLLRKYRALALEDAIELLHSPLHEERMLALLILVDRYKRAAKDAETRKRIFDLYLANTSYVNNWDLVDCSAGNIVGPWLEDKPRDALFELARSASVWDRRIAMIATSHYIRKGDCVTAIEVASLLLNDRHDLIHKAVGWMLREVGKRCGSEALTAFLDTHAATMPRTALRYALERFDPLTRQHYMSMRRSSAATRGT
jgi:3-methyladenine DNA glycosylase AlkD